MILLAMDRATVRHFDKDGRLHVETSHIAKACVSPYYGGEIPEWETLGLDPDRVYQMLRDPEELAKAAPTFDNLPVLSQHVPISAVAHRKDLTVGTTGSGTTWNPPYLDNSLSIWTQDSIDRVETDEQRELSPAYHYRADMTPGVFDLVTYDGVMRDIVGNHVALVTEGRQGPDVVVGDEHMLKSRKALMVSGAVAALVRPKLAQDAKVDLSALFGGVTAKNLKAQRGKLASSIVAAATPHLAADAALDVEEVGAAIDAIVSLKLAQDEKDEIAEDDDDEDDNKDLAEDEDDDDKKDVAEDEDSDDDGDDKRPAMDMATVRRMIAKAKREGALEGAKLATDSATALRVAEHDVFPLVGTLARPPASAEAIYRLALDSAGVPKAAYDGASLSNLKGMVEREVSLKKPARRIAQDSADSSQSSALFPNAGKLVRA